MLNYAVPAENVKAVLTPFYAPWQGKKLRYRYSRTLLDFLIWTTGWRHGFAWMPLDSANWHNARGESQITLTPEQNSVRAEIRYISKPVELNKTARYSMLMMATPAKNVEPELRNFHLGHHTGWGRLIWMNWQRTESVICRTVSRGSFPVWNRNMISS